MAYFDRYDICAAHLQLEYDYNVSGILQERESNRRRMMSTGFQLRRMGYRRDIGMTDNAKEIYIELEERYGFTKCCDALP